MASSYSGIGLHLLGPTINAITRIFLHRIQIGTCCASFNDHTIYFHYALWFDTNVLASMIDSLVRVSRRDEEVDFVL